VAELDDDDKDGEGDDYELEQETSTSNSDTGKVSVWPRVALGLTAAGCVHRFQDYDKRLVRKPARTYMLVPLAQGLSMERVSQKEQGQ
jgi:hypothetical protein